MPESKKKKHGYDILVSSGGFHIVRVEAYSPEEACKTLQRRIAGKPIMNTDITSTLVADVWSDPSDKGTGWIVTPALQSEKHATEVMAWDGKTISIHDATELVGSAFPSARK